MSYFFDGGKPISLIVLPFVPPSLLAFLCSPRRVPFDAVGVPCDSWVHPFLVACPSQEEDDEEEELFSIRDPHT